MWFCARVEPAVPLLRPFIASLASVRTSASRHPLSTSTAVATTASSETARLGIVGMDLPVRSATRRRSPYRLGRSGAGEAAEAGYRSGALDASVGGSQRPPGSGLG